MQKETLDDTTAHMQAISRTELFNHQNPCVACLGILQTIDNPEFLQKTLDTIKNSGYETENYALALTVPVSVNVRHYQIWYKLQDTFPDLNLVQSSAHSSEVPEVKEVFKWIMGHTIYVKLKMKFQFEARFEARLNIRHDETQLECLKLTPEIDEVQFLKDLEAEKRHFLRLPEAERTGDLPQMEEVTGDDDTDNYKYTGHGPPKKKRKGAAVDGVSTVNNKLHRMAKSEFVGLMWPNAERDPETNLQVSGDVTSVEKMVEFEFSFHHLAVFVGGRYCKYSRQVSQSPWIIDGVRKAEGSVQEFIGDVLKRVFKADDCKFMSAGREDIDVRMLGRGRPFVMEMVNPRRPHLDADTYRAMQKEINQNAKGLIHVLDLQEVNEKQVSLLKEGEESKRKSYRSVIWAANPVTPETISGLSSQGEFVIDQLTPIRVLHRRSLMNRKKTIHKMHGEFVNEHYSLLDLTTQAGTYIKEFVHSDLGRTKPSFASFIGQDQADILLLDVMEVALDFPPSLQNEEEPPEAPSILEGLDLTLAVPEKPASGELSLME
jgi:tRNA pseudouridine synthase 10